MHTERKYTKALSLTDDGGSRSSLRVKIFKRKSGATGADSAAQSEGRATQLYSSAIVVEHCDVSFVQEMGASGNRLLIL
jgi:hypothetical protein